MTDHLRRTMLKGAAVAGAAIAMGSAAAQVSSDQAPKVLDSTPMPEPPPEKRWSHPPGTGLDFPGQDRVCHRRGAWHRSRQSRSKWLQTALMSSSSISQVPSRRPRTPHLPLKGTQGDRSAGQILRAPRRRHQSRYPRHSSAQSDGRPGRADLRKDRHCGRQCRHPALEATAGDGGCRLARCHRQQSERHRQYHPGFRAEDGRKRSTAASLCCRRCRASTAPRTPRAIPRPNGAFWA